MSNMSSTEVRGIRIRQDDLQFIKEHNVKLNADFIHSCLTGSQDSALDYLISQLPQDNRDLYEWIRDKHPDENMIRHAFRDPKNREFLWEIADRNSVFHIESVTTALQGERDKLAFIDTTMIECQDYEGDLTSMLFDYNDLMDAYDTLESDRQDIVDLNEVLRNETVKLTAERDAIKKRNEDIKNQFGEERKRLEGEIQSLTKSISELEEKKKKLWTDNNNLHKKHDNDMQELEKEYTERKAELEHDYLRKKEVLDTGYDDYLAELNSSYRERINHWEELLKGTVNKFNENSIEILTMDGKQFSMLIKDYEQLEKKFLTVHQGYAKK